MLQDNEIEELEKKYFNVLVDLISKNLGRILTQISSQKLYKNLTETQKANLIDHSVENILEQIIATNLNWSIASLPVSADSCYECGDAVIHLDAKTTLITDPSYTSKTINIEASQTTFDSSKEILFGDGDCWQPKLKHYEEHNFFGKIPNLTYIIYIYYYDNFVEEISLVCLPHGQLCEKFTEEGNSALILNKGKSLLDIPGKTYKKCSNVRFSVKEIIKKASWRDKLLFKINHPEGYIPPEKNNKKTSSKKKNKEDVNE